MNEPFPERLREIAEAFRFPGPDLERIRRRGRARRRRRTVATGGLGVVSLLAVGLPLYLLSGLGQGRVEGPGPSRSLHQLIAFTEPVPAEGPPVGLRIAVMRPDGSGVRVLTTGREPDPYVAKYGYSSDLDPQWTPDGHAIYFLRRYSESLYSLCSVSAGGTEFRVVVRDFPAGWYALSPNGTQVAFGEGSGVFVMNVDGTARRRVVRSPHMLPNGIPITWSPDASEIAFVSARARLSVVRLSDGRLRTLTRNGAPVGSVLWNPAGSVIAFTFLRGLDAPNQVWMIRPDGSGLRRLTDGTGNWIPAAWSPDGSHLLLGRLDARLRDDGLAVIAVDSGDLHIVSDVALSGFADWRP